MVGRHDDGGDGDGLCARRVTVCARGGRVGMIVGAAVGDAVCVGGGGGVKEGRVVRVAALGNRGRGPGCGCGPRVEVCLCLSALDLVEYACARVRRDALYLPFEAKLAVYEWDVVELMDCERERERGVSREEVGEVCANAGCVERRRRCGRCLALMWDGESGGSDRRRAMSGRVSHGVSRHSLSCSQSTPSSTPPHQTTTTLYPASGSSATSSSATAMYPRPSSRR